MQRSVYRVRYNHSESTLGWIVIVTLSIILLFCIVWFFPNNDKANYKKYKSYESSIDNRLQEIIGEANAYTAKYDANEISKGELISQFGNTSNKLEKLYKSFSFKKGDIVTKELYIIKKLIIIKYAQIYKDKAVALKSGIASSEVEETQNITLLTNDYNKKDKLQKQRFNIGF